MSKILNDMLSVINFLGFLRNAYKQPAQIVECYFRLISWNQFYRFGTRPHQSWPRTINFHQFSRITFWWNSCNFPFFSHLIVASLSNIAFYLNTVSAEPLFQSNGIFFEQEASIGEGRRKTVQCALHIGRDFWLFTWRQFEASHLVFKEAFKNYVL